jgi:hypothetical protein
MTENIEDTIENINTNVPQQAPADPVVDYLSRLQFKTDLFYVLHQSQEDPNAYNQFFQTPELYVFLNMMQVLESSDPNKGTALGQKEHEAMINLCKWLAVKFATDPTWFSYIGWMFRFFTAHQHPTSYWPVKHSDRFLPKNFAIKGEPISIKQENEKMKDPSDVFKSK